MGDAGPRIELLGATRRFGALVAVSELSLVLEPGVIHALIGENGAGKSTALKLIAGHLAPSSGEVLVDGRQLSPATPEEAIRRGVGMVHQHFMLVPRMTALDNVMLGAEITVGPLGKLDRDAARERATALGQRAGLLVPLDARVEDLSVGERQRLEILRVLFRGARAVLLDEPTAVLSPVEVSELYATLRHLADAGTTVLVVTHRLDEVTRFCNHVTVIRRGMGVLDEDLALAPDLTERLTRAIMGGDIPPPADRPALPTAEPLAKIDTGRSRLSIMPGEVVGVAGIEGNGQHELVTFIAGLDVHEGSLELAGELMDDAQLPTHERVRRRRQRGIVVVHEDRHRDELIAEATVSDNLVLGDLDAALDEEGVAARRFERFGVQPSDPQRLAGELSGGNQQKVVMARALDRDIRLLALAQPTRGVDIGTARTIQRAIAEAAGAGAAVLLISADLHELRRLCHRIVVLRKGRIAGEFAPDVSDEVIGRAMLGVSGEDEVDAA